MVQIIGSAPVSLPENLARVVGLSIVLTSARRFVRFCPPEATRNEFEKIEHTLPFFSHGYNKFSCKKTSLAFCYIMLARFALLSEKVRGCPYERYRTCG